MQRIFVGDVQGCADEFETLVSRAEVEYSDDFTLWIAGDLINRGPDNRRPLERVRRLVEEGRAEYVLGNHEIHCLSVALGLRDLAGQDSLEDLLAAPDAGEWVDWLRRRPLVVPGEIEKYPFAMVHASTSPDWSLADLVDFGARVAERLTAPLDSVRTFLGGDGSKDPVRDALGRMTRCRSVPVSGGWSSREPETPDRAWHAVWAAEGHAFGVVYGHWARQGLHLAPNLRGLDTGCVHHGRGRDGFLTAWLPDAGPSALPEKPFEMPDDRIWQVPARRRYYPLE